MQSNKYDRISHFYLTILILSSIANNLKSMKGVSILGVLLGMMEVFFFFFKHEAVLSKAHFVEMNLHMHQNVHIC